jgi:hypothetical protein
MGDNMKEEKKAPQSEIEQAREHLRQLLPPEILSAPLLSWEEVDAVLVLYLYRQVRGTPWFIPLAFMLAIQRRPYVTPMHCSGSENCCGTEFLEKMPGWERLLKKGSTNKTTSAVGDMAKKDMTGLSLLSPSILLAS